MQIWKVYNLYCDGYDGDATTYYFKHRSTATSKREKLNEPLEEIQWVVDIIDVNEE